jgi:DNA-binding NtrC family response regulator
VTREPTGKCTVIVLDDDRSVQGPLRKALDPHGGQVVRVSTAEGAMRALMTRADVDAVVVDVTSREAATFLARQPVQSVGDRARLVLVDDDTKRDPTAMSQVIVDRVLAARRRRPPRLR